MTSKFEEMGYKFGDKFVVVRDYYDLKVGDIVIAVSSDSTNTIDCVKEGSSDEHTMYFSKPCKDGYIEVIPYKEALKTNTLNVGDMGSPHYEAIRKVLAVLDGDEVRASTSDNYGLNNYISLAADKVTEAISYQTKYPQGYQLKSEQQVLSEKDLKIKELADNIESMKKNLEELKGV